MFLSIIFNELMFTLPYKKEVIAGNWNDGKLKMKLSVAIKWILDTSHHFMKTKLQGFILRQQGVFLENNLNFEVSKFIN